MENKLICFLKKYWYKLEWLKLRIVRIGKKYPIKRPLISIYCPTHNRGKVFIERAMKSVLAQTYKNWEFIIVCDNCESDHVSYVLLNLPLDTYADRIKIYNIHTKKSYPMTPENHWFCGPVEAANYALKEVSGDWIARIDDDDIWTDDHLESLLKRARKTNAEFVSGKHIEKRYGKVKEVDIPSDWCTKDNAPMVGGTQTWLYRSYLKFFKYNPDCWRKKWNKVNDIDLQERMFNAGVRMAFLNKVVAKVFPRPGEKTVGLEAYRKYNIKD